MTPTPVERLLALHPDCRVCGKSAVTVRERGNPKWGFEDDGFTPRKDPRDWLDADPDPDQIEGVCLSDLDVPRLSDGSFPASATGSAHPQTWPERRKAEKVRARADLIEAAGGVCENCKTERPPSEMRIRTPGLVRRNYDINSTSEWYDFLRSRPSLMEGVELLCIGCDRLETSQDLAKLSARAQVVRAYGGECSHPSCDRTADLMVTALPGTATPRWPNGDKYTSAAKCSFLVRHGFPQGWALACPSHLNQVRRGGM